MTSTRRRQNRAVDGGISIAIGANLPPAIPTQRYAAGRRRGGRSNTTLETVPTPPVMAATTPRPAGRRRGGRNNPTLETVPTPPVVEATTNTLIDSDDNIGRLVASRRRRSSATRQVGSGGVGLPLPIEQTTRSPPTLPSTEPTNNHALSSIEIGRGISGSVALPTHLMPELPAVTNKQAATYNHATSNPITKSGASLRRLGLINAGYNDRRQQRVRERTNNERFSTNFGVSAKTLEAVFLDMKEKDASLKENDFLMAVDTLKLYLLEGTMAGRWGCCEQTYREKWKKIVADIAALRDDKIRFDPSDFPEDQIFLLTVDGVNFNIREPRVKNPGSHWYNHKSHSAGLTYFVGIDVRRSRICWIDGPRPGKYTLKPPTQCHYNDSLLCIYCYVLSKCKRECSV